MVEVTNSSGIQLGRVKWFNNKTGFGFITITDGSNIGNDVFVHHSSIKVVSEQYKYLVQGEYVEFVLLETNGGKHQFQAGEVKGIKGGKLMCETRKEFKLARNNFINEKLEVKGTQVSVPVHNNLDRHKSSKSNNEEWKDVVKRNSKTTSDKKSKVKK